MKSASDLMAEGQMLMSEQPGAAMQLLIEGRNGLAAIPVAYDMMLSRAAVAAGEPDFALAHLSEVFGEGEAPPPLRRVYGEALASVGRISEAGEQLDMAVQAGLPAETLSLHLKLILQDYWRLRHSNMGVGGLLDKRVIAEYGVIDEGNRILFVYVPKVACTILKATVVMNSPRREAYLTSGMPIHEFVGRERDEGKLMNALIADDTFRFAVIRDPATRVLSAYLNKFVPAPPREPLGILLNKQYAIRTAQRLAGVKLDTGRGITFEEFVHFLAQAHDLEMDPHWMPQARIIGSHLSLYDHLGRFEQLSKTFEILEQRFGYVIERDSSTHLGGQTDHATKYNLDQVLHEPARLLPAELRRLGSMYPPADAFLTPRLRDILDRRFAADLDLHS